MAALAFLIVSSPTNPQTRLPQATTPGRICSIAWQARHPWDHRAWGPAEPSGLASTTT